MQSDSSGGDLAAMRGKLIQATAWKWRLLHAVLLFRETYHIMLERMTTIKCENESRKTKKGLVVVEPNKDGEESDVTV